MKAESASLITDYLAGNPERNQPRLLEAAKDVCGMTAVHGGTYLIYGGVTNDVYEVKGPPVLISQGEEIDPDGLIEISFGARSPRKVRVRVLKSCAALAL